ncbi:hypothetical protein [Chroococcidiopsis sp. SAG 2025]|uniref:hypothetical protein n=1 Tax=Chroococcidiopsis sp. SAG 2025 TaxID=171389 RepID=UPI0029373E42|nr:hypothetical protein [Chroococcidiopsis sp. SAG 2025]
MNYGTIVYILLLRFKRDRKLLLQLASFIGSDRQPSCFLFRATSDRLFFFFN